MKSIQDKLTIRITNFIASEMATDKAITKAVVLSATIRALEALKIKGVKNE